MESIKLVNMVGIKTYEALLKCKIAELDRLNPIYTLSGGIDSSLIFSYLNNPECFCAQANGNEDWHYAKKLYPMTKKISFNDVDIEELLIGVQSLYDEPYCNMSDMYDYFVYTRFPDRLIIVGEEPRFDENGINITKYIRRLFFKFPNVDSPYMYNQELYRKEYVRELVRRRLPRFIAERKKRDYTGPNPIWKRNHEFQIELLKNKYDIVEDDFNEMWKKLNFAIWYKLNK
jgi:asparagine synthetase B (glutamine-hydrolysing)